MTPSEQHAAQVADLKRQIWHARDKEADHEDRAHDHSVAADKWNRRANALDDKLDALEANPPTEADEDAYWAAEAARLTLALPFGDAL